MVYTSVAFDVADLPANLSPYLPFVSSYLTMLGTKTLDFKEFSQFEKANTAGVGASLSFSGNPNDLDMMDEATLFLSGGCIDYNIDALSRLLSELTTAGSVRWVESDACDRFAELIERRAASLGSGIADNGRGYGLSRVEARLLACGALDDKLSGLPHVEFARQIAGAISEGGQKKEQAMAEVGAACRGITEHAFTRDRLRRMRVCGASNTIDRLVASQEEWQTQLPSSGELNHEQGPPLHKLWQRPSPSECDKPNEFIAVPSQTNYVVRGFKTVPYTHPDAPKLVLLGQALSLGFLHREIREKGGAYGASASAASTSGSFLMSSYRDPRQMETLKCFDEAIDWARSSITAQDVEQAQLQCFKSLDAPVARKHRGTRRFGYPSLTDEMRQTFREGLLDATPQCLAAVAEKYIGQTSAHVDCIVGNWSTTGNGVEGWDILGPDLKPIEGLVK